MEESPTYARGAPAILLVMTGVTGVVDAVSFLALGRIFTANMTGNIVLLGFALGGAPDISIPRSLLALGCFLIGAMLGGRISGQMTREGRRLRVICAFVAEVTLLLTAGTLALGLAAPSEGSPLRMRAIVAATAVAMGLRNAVVRKLGVADLTTTVLTMTITTLAADSVFAGGDNPRWLRRGSAIVVMVAGAAAGALMLRRSLALPLYACAFISAACAFAWSLIDQKVIDQKQIDPKGTP
jgi:uncharacterized membrane protein YoaK (UPF0700 family)